MTKETAGDDFGALLETLGALSTESNTMVKALAADSEFEMDEEGKQKLDGEGKPIRKPVAGAEGGEMMGKAFTATLSDGTTAEGIDATDILKALDTDMNTLRKTLPGLLGVIRVQGNMLKALQTEVATMRGTGAGRRAVLSVHERAPAVAAPENQERGEGRLSPGEFMAKALDAKAGGAISSLDLTRLEAGLNKGVQPTPELAAAVMNFRK